jgi:hypothetical protein
MVQKERPPFQILGQKRRRRRRTQKSMTIVHQTFIWVKKLGDKQQQQQ